MKTLKLAAFALALGFFAASCGSSETTETTVTDSTVVTPEAQPEVAPTPAPATVDSPAATTTTTTTTTDTTVKK